MNTQTRSKAFIPMQQNKILSALTTWIWVVAASLSILFYFAMRSDLSGIQWLGSPLMGMALLGVFTTAYCFVARNRPIQPTVHIVIWLFLLFLATTLNMLTLAHFVFDGWEDFQAMPVMGTFQLILIALGVHLSWKEKARGALFIFMIWTVVLFLLTACTMISLAYAFFNGWDAWQTYPMLGIGIWTGLMLVATFGFKSRFVSWLDALVGWAWCMCIGTSLSMLGVYIVLLNLEKLWPFYPIVGTFSLALLVTLVSMPERRRLAAR